MLSELLSIPPLPQILNYGSEDSDHDFSFELDNLGIISNYKNPNDFFSEKSVSNFSFLNYNIRSLPAKYDEFNNFLSNKNCNFEAILLTESWISDQNSPFLEFKNYNSFHVHRSSKKGGGVSVLVRSDLSSNPVKEHCFVNEYIEINTVKISHLSSEIFVVGVYRPPSSRPERFLEIIENTLRKLNKKTIILAGDLNFDLLKINKDQNVTHLMNSLLSSGLYPTTTRATRLNKSNPLKSSLIDLTWTNLDHFHSSHILTSDLSDHFPCVTNFKFPIQAEKLKFILHHYRDNKKEKNINNYVNAVSNIDFDFIDNPSVDIMDKFLTFDSNIFDCYDNSCPIKSYRLSTKRLDNPWISAELREEISQKHNLYNLYISGAVPKELYNNFKSYLKKKIENSKKSYFSRKIEETKGDIRKQWKFLNSIINKKTIANTATSKIEVDGEVFADPSTIPGKINEQFSTVGDNIQSGIVPNNIDPISFLNNIKHNSTFSLRPVTEMEVKEVIMSLKNKSCNINKLPNAMYKAAVNTISKPLSKLINLSLATSTFPSLYKHSFIIPLFKSGCRSNINNYRPISLLATTSKIIEKLINIQILEYFNSNSLFSKYQFGFRKFHNTQDANAMLLENIYKYLNEKSNVLVTFLDLKKAFDSVDQNLLLKKLKFYGFDHSSIKWMSSYLLNRTQSVTYNSITSSSLPVRYGVPQGSVLGPTLFNIFINDFQYAHSAISYQYADDTTIITQSKNFSELEVKTNSNLTSISEWLNANLLAPNTLKTVYMVITNKRRANMNILLNGQTIKEVKSYKCLGLTIDNKLNFHEHCKNVSAKLARVNYIIYRNKFDLNFKSKITLYYSLANPHLLYNCALWANAPACYLNKVLVSQNKIIRNLWIDSCPTSEKFSHLGILTIKELYVHQCLIYYFQIKNMACPELVRHLIPFTVSAHNYNTRNSFNVRPNFNLAISQKALSFQAPTLWNQMPANLQELECSKRTFSKRVRKSILTAELKPVF